MSVVAAATNCWESLADFRRERDRCVGYTFGDQWRDMINDNGRMVREEDYIKMQGNHPFKNNLIRRIVRNVVGIFRDTLTLREEEGFFKGMASYSDDKMAELLARTMEEYLISGVAVHKKWRVAGADGKPMVKTGIVSPGSFFYDRMARDPRGTDISILGQIHELRFGTFCREFVSSRGDYVDAVAKYGGNAVRVVELWRRETRERRLCHDRDRSRVLKVDEKIWQLSPELRRMPSKWILDDVWRYYYTTADGVVLREGDSPYSKSGHPYVLKAYPFLDGEVHSLVGDVIDQQRYTNRLITLYDWVMRAAAKGVLLFPQNALPMGTNVEAVMDQWSQFNGVIVYDGDSGSQPQQVNNLGSNQGVSELLSIQLKMMEDVAGVNGALQGRVDSGSMSGTMYEQQTKNALVSLRDLLDSFETFISDSIAKEREILSAYR